LTAWRYLYISVLAHGQPVICTNIMSTSENVQAALSQLSLSSSEQQSEDWDRTLRVADNSPNISQGEPRKRTLSELLKLHAEKGKDLDLSPEEASAVAEVLGRWVCISI
jgi:hypothetical protein